MEQDLVKELLSDAERKMRTAVEVLEQELKAMRTARAATGLVEHIAVNYYGSQAPLQQLATIHVPEPRMITIQPWDRNAFAAIEKAIRLSDLGVTPSSDGQIIRVVLPPLTEERRHELVRMVHRRVEEARVAVRNVRRDTHSDLREMEKERMITQDDLHWSAGKLQELTDHAIAQANHAGERKEKDILEG